jgi:hypothetical protein
MKKDRFRHLLTAMLFSIMVAAMSLAAFGQDVTTDTETEGKDGGYTLDQVVILSRHNIRSPLSAKGSALYELTPHKWFAWTSKPSELSLRGALLETEMGQYFRLWLEKEGLFPENYVPEDGAVRFYANGLQRTQATAHYFAAGLLPVANVTVERKGAPGDADDTFLPKVYFLNDSYQQDVMDEIDAMYDGKGLAGCRESLDGAFQLLTDVLDMKESEGWKSGKYGNFLEDASAMTLEQGKEPSVKGPLSTAVSLADALVLQYYEEPDDRRAAFGHDLSEEDWKTIGSVLRMNLELRFSTPLLAVNQAHLMLEELYQEMNTDGRKLTFLCGHDSTLASVLNALGVKDYVLPEAVEPTVPIGSKVVFERFTDAGGNAFYKICMVYQSVDQLRSIQQLSLETPPMIVPLSFQDVNTNDAGMIAEADLMKLFQDKIDSYYGLEEQYQEDELEQAA